MAHRDTQLVDTAHLLDVLLDKCERVGMTSHGHRILSERYHPRQAKMQSLNAARRRALPDATFGLVCVAWVKVFGWSLVIKIDGQEYVVNSRDDIHRMVDEYVKRHDRAMFFIEKTLLADKGGPSLSRFYYGTIKEIQLNTTIRAVEGLGGHVFLRRPAKR